MGNNNIKRMATSKNVAFYTFLWLFSVTAMTIALTNLFTESFEKKDMLFLFLLLPGTIFIVRLWIEYLRKA